MLFGVFVSATPGVEVGNNATILLGDEGEPQPDLFLRVLPECGGQSRTTAHGHIDGAPDLIAEVAYATEPWTFMASARITHDTQWLSTWLRC